MPWRGRMRPPMRRPPGLMFTDDRYRRAAAAGGVGVWEWTLATGDMYIDPVLKRLLGYEDHEICNHIDDWSRRLQPDDAPMVLQMRQAHIRGDSSSYEIEHRMLHRDGSVRWVLARGTVIRDAEGRAVGMAGTDTDITERKRGEEALWRARELNRQIAESTGDCVKILALDGRLLYINPEGLRMLELTDAGQMLNRTISAFFDGETAEMADAACA